MDAEESMRRKGYIFKDLERWMQVLGRFGFESRIGRYEGRPIVAVKVINKRGNTKEILVDSLEGWKEFSDSHLYFTEPVDTIFYDKFQPRFAKFKEKEIHKWIKEYKEED